MKKNIFNFTCVFITILTLLFSSCQVEENLVPRDITSSSYKIKNISSDEIDSNYKIVEKLKKLDSKKSNSTSKNIAFNDLGIIIQTDYARYIEDGNYHSYTFSTIQDDTENIQNVLFSLNEKGDYDAFLVKYAYNKLQLESFDKNNKPGTATLEPINLDIKSLTSKFADLWVCKYDYVLVSTPDLVGADNARQSWILVASTCTVISANVIEEDSSTTNYGSGTASNTTSGYANPSAGGGGGKITTSPLFAFYDEPEIIKIETVKKQLQIGIQQKIFLEKNGELAFMIYDHLASNRFSEDSKNFGRWILNYLMQNPTVTIEQFKNWFMGTSEGQDGEYIDPTLIEYETPLTQQQLPSLVQWINNFPKIEQNGYWYPMSSSEVYKLAGGSLYNSSINEATKSQYTNACAIRGSRALLYSGITIPVLKYGKPSIQVTQKGGDNLNYILSANSFNRFMIDKFGETSDRLEGDDANDPVKVANLLRGKSGIYVIINKSPGKTGAGYSGHVDAIVNGICISNAYSLPKGGVLSIRIWSLN